MASAVLEVANVALFCRSRGISRQTFYKWRRRFAESGLEGLSERSRAPGSSPGAWPRQVRELAVAERARLAKEGVDCGADSVADALAGRLGGARPSASTVHRWLAAAGASAVQPRKRPRSAGRRFCHDRPNACWQADWTEWRLADGSPVAIAGVLDDCSRLSASLVAGPGDGTAELVWAGMAAAIAERGVPAMVLTDNGLVYSTARRTGMRPAAFEENLRLLGAATVCSTPGHPQTLGKIERSWQTLKRWLDARPAPADTAGLQGLLDEYRDHYNNRRRHRGIGRRTPADVWASTAPARPASRPAPARAVVTACTATKTGVACAGGHDIAVGVAWAGQPLTVIQDGDYAAVLHGNRVIRTLTIDPARRHQPLHRRHMAA